MTTHDELSVDDQHEDAGALHRDVPEPMSAPRDLLNTSDSAPPVPDLLGSGQTRPVPDLLGPQETPAVPDLLQPGADGRREPADPAADAD